MPDNRRQIIDINVTQHMFHSIPEPGFYVYLTYMYGDGEIYQTVEYGPFPEENKPQLVKFMNLLEDMLEYSHSGKFDENGYQNLPGYKAWFEYESICDPRIRKLADQLCIETQANPNANNNPAPLTSYEIYYYDGESKDRYAVEIQFEPEKK